MLWFLNKKATCIIFTPLIHSLNQYWVALLQDCPQRRSLPLYHFSNRIKLTGDWKIQTGTLTSPDARNEKFKMELKAEDNSVMKKVLEKMSPRIFKYIYRLFISN